MSKKIMRLVHIAVIIFFSSLLGCTAALVGAGAGAGVGTYSYIKGELKVTYSYKYTQVVSATESAIRELGFTVKEEKKDMMKYRLKAKMADGTGVKIKIDRVSESITVLRIKIGWFGNKNLSIQIMKAIEKKLPSPKTKS